MYIEELRRMAHRVRDDLCARVPLSGGSRHRARARPKTTASRKATARTCGTALDRSARGARRRTISAGAADRPRHVGGRRRGEVQPGRPGPERRRMGGPVQADCRACRLHQHDAGSFPFNREFSAKNLAAYLVPAKPVQFPSDLRARGLYPRSSSLPGLKSKSADLDKKQEVFSLGGLHVWSARIRSLNRERGIRRLGLVVSGNRWQGECVPPTVPE